MNISVIAGDPLDTQMGVTFLKKNNLNARGYPAASTAEEQTMIMQMMTIQERTNIIRGIFEKAILDGTDGFFIYCNSLSAAVDFDALAQIYKTIVITPLHVYKILAKKYDRIMVIAGNNQALAGIEKTICIENPDCYVIGIGCFPIVQAVESGLPPEKIVEIFSFEKLMGLYAGADCECFILGCTHFSYFQSELMGKIKIPIINPAAKMLELLLQQLKDI